MKVKHHNEEAAASLFTFVLLFFLCAILFIMVGFGVDKITMISANMFTGIGDSQLRYETANVMILAFRVEPIIMLLGLMINNWVSTLRVNTGMADTGTMIIAGAEMITMSLIMIVFTLFGGYALDNLVNFINKFTVITPDLSLYSAVQYITPCFYGIMFLILMGIIIQFIMTCVRTVDIMSITPTPGINNQKHFITQRRHKCAVIL